MNLLPAYHEGTSPQHTLIYIPMHIRLPIMADNFSNTNVSGASFGSQDSSLITYGHDTNFEVSDFLEFDGWFEKDAPAFSSVSAGYSPQLLNHTLDEVVVNSDRSLPHDGTANSRDSGGSRDKKEIREKVAFKTKSEVEILDDGFKWRKYGKKMVKNSPNPRNYYRCSVEGCSVKKRVERDKEDQRYVITTYEGIHNHEGPTL
ncbi:hypothetical protein CDL12_05750 [Handroanthus impetiginosus]|uniref:WRKY domain-containing protein n=1 Tax=Handroanthus impetiginosus TaxID=429701 RepID=A0A2G9HW23_9LAMI|nr:hypothetical protein CDL12_05750 [Handroanthus impetiginosus]